MRFDDRAIREMAERLRQKTPQAVRRSLKRAGDSGRIEMARLVAADTALGVRYVRDQIKVEQPSDLSLFISVTGKRLPLIQFRARGPEPSRGRGRGVSYNLGTGGGRGRIADAFIATMGSGHRGVFKRAPGARTVRTAKGRSGLPIIELYGPSLVKVFEKYQPQAQLKARQAFQKALWHELVYGAIRAR